VKCLVRYYLDTSIWLDCYEKRGRNGLLALSFLRKLEAEKATIL
jgi:hypothetical protein